jgi:hypothetical protein
VHPAGTPAVVGGVPGRQCLTEIKVTNRAFDNCLPMAASFARQNRGQLQTI